MPAVEVDANGLGEEVRPLQEHPPYTRLRGHYRGGDAVELAEHLEAVRVVRAIGFETRFALDHLPRWQGRTHELPPAPATSTSKNGGLMRVGNVNLISMRAGSPEALRPRRWFQHAGAACFDCLRGAPTCYLSAELRTRD